MLSYQHAYHAGNFADCHKHAVLCALLQTLQAKDSALTFYDFFAGRGMYSLSSPEAKKTGEYAGGIAKIWHADDAPAALQPFLKEILRDNLHDLNLYPGSPLLIKRALRAQDWLICNDAHPQEYRALEYALGCDPRMALHQRDAWEAMQALLPPREPYKTPRGLVLLDPAYEVKSDYTVIVEACEWALKKFMHGVYMIWYPLLPAGHHQTMLDLFQKHITAKTLHSQLVVKNGQEMHGPRIGMYGSGVIIINPPWQFDETVQTIGDYLASHLKQDNTARHGLDWLVEEKRVE